MKKAVLFDIDGTIMHSGRAGKEAFVKASLETYGSFGTLDVCSYQGRTDLQLLYENLEPAGIDSDMIDRGLQKFKALYIKLLQLQIKKNECVLMPGIREILCALREDSRNHIGLLTGNFRQSAFVKLDKFSLSHYFSFGAFSDDTHIRNQMPDIALRKLQEATGDSVPPKRTFIIGDTIFDIECAKKSGSVSIAVSTGWTPEDTLKEHNPDYLFKDLKDTDRIKSIIASS